MKKSPVVNCQLGDLIYELFEQAKEVTSKPIEQRLLVYAALKDLLTNQYRKQLHKAA
jgi:hypothetical protein